MKYTLSFLHLHEQLIDVKIELEAVAGKLQLHLPQWRPGRYELQQYARNITDVQALTLSGDLLGVSKSATNIWDIEVPEAGEIIFSYRYYANQLDAGGSYLDENWIYVNGINLFMYRENQLEEPCELVLNLPEGYQLAGGLADMETPARIGNFHQLVDMPFFAAKDLIHDMFEIEGIPTHLWFLGDCQPDLKTIRTDISSYTQAQLDLFGHFPVKDYHYLFLMLPYRYRHGVEHHNSTVIVMGPGHLLMQPETYRSFLEISSHELFHTWNVKALRPMDMWPYSYDAENYSRLHYVTEGVTTYYGDLMLWKGGTWDLDQWVSSINGELRMHYQMSGKNYTSLEEASFDSWINGYSSEGVPNRRISFYTKGYLVAMLTDFQIRKASGNDHSLDDVMHNMYHNLARNGKAYTKEDYWERVEMYAGMDMSDFYANYIAGSADLLSQMSDMGSYFGLQLTLRPFGSRSEAWWGMKSSTSPQGSVIVENLMPGSAAIQAGLSKGDEIISVNGRKLENNWEELLAYYSGEESIDLHYFHLKKLKSARFKRESELTGGIPQFFIQGEPSEEQLQNRRAWKQIKVGRGVESN